MTPTERRLFAGLLGALAERFSDQGHPMQMVTNERLGYCTVWGCGDTCRVLSALFIEASELLEREMETDTQLSIFDEVSG